MQTPKTVIFLFILVAVIMATHFYVLAQRSNVCANYERLLFDRLAEANIASKESRELRAAVENTFSGALADCSNSTRDFSDASNTYLAVILSLLTGAGFGVSAGASWNPYDKSTEDRLLDRGNDD